MYKEEYDALANAGSTKVKFLKNNFLGYFISSALAGIFVGFGVLLAYTISGLLNGQVATKIIMGGSFSVALSLVVIAGADLFTGNTMTMGAGILKKTVKFSDAVKLLVVCYFGNFFGAILLSFMFQYSGLNVGNTALAIASSAEMKMAIPFTQLIIRGILCNFLVCLAVWCGFKCKSESAKLIMIFWCMLAFFTVGFEHCVANMTVLTVALLEPCNFDVSISGYLYNLLNATFANIVGGALFVAVPYFIIAKTKNK